MIGGAYGEHAGPCQGCACCQKRRGKCAPHRCKALVLPVGLNPPSMRRAKGPNPRGWPDKRPPGIARCLALLLTSLIGSRLPSCGAYRVVDPNGTTPTPFQPYETGFVRQYGDPLIFQRERVNEGAPATEDQPRIFEGVFPRQLCPNMVGPLNGVYYCRGKEYGYCDQRSGICFCNMGYSGLGCESCSPTHYQEGELCYPKRLCPNDCSGGGTCDYVTGTCKCDVHRSGSDCSQPICTEFDPLCVYCTNSTCLRCPQGYSVSSLNRCHPCTRFDPRCVSCNSDSCLVCGDPLLLSIRRSGRRLADPWLPLDEKSRALSVAYPFGTQLVEYFDEAEDFDMVGADISSPLNQTSRACAQGQQGDAHWTCHSFWESNTVCGHKGTLSFSSPTYEVKEGVRDFIRITVSRTGGGYGSVSANYSLHHLTTDASDVVATAYYTTDQTLTFDEGVVQVSFLVRIPDDSRLDGTKQFSLHLTDVRGGAVLGPQSAAIVTIKDNDYNKTSPWLSYPAGDGLAKAATAGVLSNLTVFAVGFTGQQRTVGGDFFIVSIENGHADTSTGQQQQQQEMAVGEARVPYTDGWCSDRGNGSYPCGWKVKQKGTFLLRAFQLVPHGLEGDYYENAFFGGNKAFTRVDHVLNFTWGSGRLTETATDFVSVRWHGRLRANYSETHTFTVSADDHVRLWIDHNMVIDQWDRLVDFSHAKVNLTANHFHHLLVEYRELRESAHMQLWWSSKSTPFQIVPSVNLFRQYELSRSPVQVKVRSAATNADMTYCQGPGLTKGVAGETLWFYIYPMDSFGNRRDDSDAAQMSQEGLQYQAEASLVTNVGQGRGTTLVSSTIAYDAGLHAYRVEYTPTISGVYSLNVTYQAWRFDPRLPVRGSPFTVDVEEARTFAARCVVHGAGLFTGKTGEAQNFTIVARDAMSNWRHEGGDDIEVMAYSHDQVTVTYGEVQDLGNGTYHVTLTPLVQGTYDLHLLLKTPRTLGAGYSSFSSSIVSHIGSSPYRLYVHHNVAYGPACTATGKGVVTGIAGYQSQFVVVAKDRWGNQLRNNDFNVTVVALASKRVVGKVFRYNNGTSLVVYAPESAGLNYLSVKVNGQHISGSPFSVQVADGDTKANTSTATGEALYAAMAGVPATVVVHAKDAYGNPRTVALDADEATRRSPIFNLTLHGGPHGAAVTNTSIYLSEGRHLVTYNATVAGSYNLTIADALTGEEVDFGTLFTPYVRPAPGSPLQSHAYGSGVTKGTAGAQIPVYIQSVDAFGNLLNRGGDVYLASLWGPFNCSEICRYNRSGPSYRNPLVPETAATLLPITSAPYNSLLSSLSPLHNTSTSYSPLDGPNGAAAYQAVTLSVTNYGNGTYSVPYTVPQSGAYRLQISMGLSGRLWATYYRSLGFKLPYLGRQESGLNLTWGPYGASQGHRQGNTTVSTHELFSLVLRGFIKVPVDGDYTFHATTDSASQIEVFVGGTAVIIQPSTAAAGNRRQQRSSPSSYLLDGGSLYALEVRYQHTGRGEDPSVTVAWSTSASPVITTIPPSALYLFYPIANRTYTPQIVPAALHPPTSTAEGSALTQATAGYPAYFTLFARDASGNLLLPGSANHITVIGRGPSRSADFLGSVVQDKGDGSYNISYTPLVAGGYNLLVTISSSSPAASSDLGYYGVDESVANAHVSGSPFRLLVTPASLHGPTTFLTGLGTSAATAGLTAYFTISPRDWRSNTILSSAEVMASVANFSIYMNATTTTTTPQVHAAQLAYSAADKTIAGTFNVTKAGPYHLRAYYNGMELSGSPYQVAVSPNGAYGPACGVDIDRFPDKNSSASFTIHAADYWHNHRDVGGDRFFVKIFGPEVIYPSILDLGNGAYTVGYMPRLNGIYNVTVELAQPGGLTGHYYETRRMQGSPYAVQVDRQLDYDWGFDKPLVAGSSLTHHVSVRWTGFLLSPLDDSFTFTTELGGYDVARVFVADQLVIEHNNEKGRVPRVSRSVPLRVDRLYEIVVELEHVAGPCSLTLYWETGQIPRQPVPSYYLYSSSHASAQSPIRIYV